MNRGIIEIGTTGADLVSRFNSNFQKLRLGERVWNVEDYGAKHDGVVGTPATGTDDTAAIQAAINACITAGGGVVYFPRGVYKIAGELQAAVNDVPYNSQLYLPDVEINGAARVVIQLIGEIPQLLYQSINARSRTAQTGVVLYSTIAGSGVFPSVFCSMRYGKGNNLNYHNLHIENIQVIVRAFQSTTGPSMCGVNLHLHSDFFVNNLQIGIDCEIIQSIMPESHVFGFAGGKWSDDWPHVGKLDVSGFYYGVVFGEGVHARDVMTFGNYIGLMMTMTHYGASIDYLVTHWNAFDIASQQEAFYGSNPGKGDLNITFWGTEDAVEGSITYPAWVFRQDEILDTLNRLYGYANYSTGSSNGGIGHYITKSNGGHNFLIKNMYTSSNYHWATATRPASPGYGVTGWNTTTNKLEVWNGAAWADLH